jgi:FkbM family methyltransferase
MGAITRKITAMFLKKNNKKHLENYPQLAVFSFDLITKHIHLDGRFERDELNFLAKDIFPQLPGRRTCLDIGANIGNHTLFFAEYFTDIIALEPNPRTFKLLDINAQLVDNITPVNKGASDKSAIQTAYFHPQNVGATSLTFNLSEGSAEQQKKAELKLDRVDDMDEVKNAANIDFVKIDVEGHEEACISGALKTLEKHKPVIGIEILSAQIIKDKSPALDMLEPLGYKYFYNLRTNRPLAWAPKPIAKLTTIFLGVFFNYRPPKAFTLEPLVLQNGCNFPMVLCSTTKLV